MALVALSFYVRKTIGHRLRRLIHYLSFVVFLLALIHGLMSGTDSNANWTHWLYWASSGSVVFLTMYRVLILAPKATAKA